MARTLMKPCAHACVRGCVVLGRFGGVFYSILFYSTSQGACDLVGPLYAEFIRPRVEDFRQTDGRAGGSAEGGSAARM